MENFITKINVIESIKVRNLFIPLSTKRRQHLILTGMNGSGKTSLLNRIHNSFYHFSQGKQNELGQIVEDMELIKIQIANEKDNLKKNRLEIQLNSLLTDFSIFGSIFLEVSGKSDSYINYKGLLITLFSSRRELPITKSSGFEMNSLPPDLEIGNTINDMFIGYLLHLKTQRAFAYADGELDAVEEIDKWFKKVEEILCRLLGFEHLQLQYNRKGHNFKILVNGDEEMTFQNISDGYSSILSIATEIIMQLEGKKKNNLEAEGIIFIDEIEAHLHVELQKKIFPFLVELFPKMQFIVSTHSPFVLTSVGNATICDLEKHIITTDLSSYSYEAIIESYFGLDNYSDEVKLKLNHYEMLLQTELLSPEQKTTLKFLKEYFSKYPMTLSPELKGRLHDLHIQELLKDKSKK